MEYEAVDEGTLAKILVPEGTQDVPVNAPIAVLAGEGEDVKAAAASAAATPEKSRHRRKRRRRRRRQYPASPQPSPQRGEGARPATPQAQSPAPLPSGREVAEGGAVRGLSASHGARIFASPLARRLAKEAGIDLSRIQGSGPHGRVIARDIDERKIRQGPARTGRRRRWPQLPRRRCRDQQVLALYEEGSYELIPHDSMRRTIAQRLTAAAQSMPRVLSHRRLRHRQAHGRARGDQRAGAEGKDGKPAYKLSVNDFVIKALALALQRVPDGECELDRRRDAPPQAFRHRRRGRAAVRADHADHPPGRDQIAVRDLERDARALAARARTRS